MPKKVQKLFPFFSAKVKSIFAVKKEHISAKKTTIKWSFSNAFI